jgi:hypothetical protein
MIRDEEIAKSGIASFVSFAQSDPLEGANTLEGAVTIEGAYENLLLKYRSPLMPFFAPQNPSRPPNSGNMETESTRQHIHP